MTYTYDEDGNLTARADSSSHSTTYAYDYLNRRTAESFPGGHNNIYTYDRASNLASLVDDDGTTSYTYDNANRLASVTSPKPGSGTSTISYTYTDPVASTDSSKVTIAFPGGLSQESTIDAAGNVISVKVLHGTTILKKRDYSYLQTIAGTTTVSALIQSMTDEAANTTSYAYGAADRLAEAARVNGTTPVDDWLYTYDAAGNRTLRRHTVETGSPVNTSFGYNTAHELCYSVTGTPTGSCAAPPTGATTYTYDADGQRTTGPTAAYDVQQRLTTLSGTALSYLSPGNGELSGYGTTSYQNNLLGLGRVIPSSGTATDLIRAPSGGTLAQRVGTSSKQELFTDALGSTIATADDGATTLSRSYDYDPDGNATASGSGTDAVVRYAGGYTVGGLYHYGARYYDPSTATWTQQDPLNQISSLTEANHYAYAGGNPINAVDLAGLQGSPCVGDRPSPAARANNPAITVAWCKRYQASTGNPAKAAWDLTVEFWRDVVGGNTCTYDKEGHIIDCSVSPDPAAPRP
jgi:RHS repeat-associated protein